MPSTQGAPQLCLNGWVQQFFPSLGYGNAFWVLPVYTGMRHSCAPFLISALLLHGEKTLALGQVGAVVDTSISLFCTLRTPRFCAAIKKYFYHSI